MFYSELELQKQFVYNMKKKLDNNEFVSEEFNARFGNVDIIKVCGCNSLILNKNQAEVLSNISSARVLGYLHKNAPRTLNYLVKNTGYTSEYILSIIIKLKTNKLIIEYDEKKYLINSQFEFPKLIFKSYEAKLLDWKKAISQALKNQAFSSESYVVMPYDTAFKIISKYRDYFEDYNIGLIGVDNGKNKVLFKPICNLKLNNSKPMFICSVAKYYLLKEQNV